MEVYFSYHTINSSLSNLDSVERQSKLNIFKNVKVLNYFIRIAFLCLKKVMERFSIYREDHKTFKNITINVFLVN